MLCGRMAFLLWQIAGPCDCVCARPGLCMCGHLRTGSTAWLILTSAVPGGTWDLGLGPASTASTQLVANRTNAHAACAATPHALMCKPAPTPTPSYISDSCAFSSLPQAGRQVQGGGGYIRCACNTEPSLMCTGCLLTLSALMHHVHKRYDVHGHTYMRRSHGWMDGPRAPVLQPLAKASWLGHGLLAGCSMSAHAGGACKASCAPSLRFHPPIHPCMHAAHPRSQLLAVA